MKLNQLKITTIRTNLNISQKKLAQLANISQPHLSKIENGTIKPSYPTIIKIANALNVNPIELYHHNDNYLNQQLCQIISQLPNKTKNTLLQLTSELLSLHNNQNKPNSPNNTPNT